MTQIDEAKQAIRERIWTLLEREAVVEPGVRGYIPDFHGAAQAAERLATLSAWSYARVIKAVPDRAQLPVRARALKDGKLLYMAVPRLAAPKPFYLLDPDSLDIDPWQAADRDTAARIAKQVDTDLMCPVDLIVCGSVAVNHAGARLGKGAGYSDIEVALLAEAGLIGKHTVIATTVHDLQIVEDELPEQAHDFRVDVIVTPSRVVSCSPTERPHGLHWENLTNEKIEAIPALKARRMNR